MKARTPQGASPPPAPRLPSRGDLPTEASDGSHCPVILRWLDHNVGRYRDLLRTIGGASRPSLASIPVRR